MKNNPSLYQKTQETLKTYVELDGISRHEEKVAQTLKRRTLSENLEHHCDGLGSLLISFKEKNSGPTVLIATHMDEVGFLVLDILADGFLRLSAVGGIWTNVVVGTRGKLHVAKTGKTYDGIFGHSAIHVLSEEKRKKALPLEELFFDLGFASKEEAESYGVTAGDAITFVSQPFQLVNPKLYAAKAMDNRVSVAALEMLIQRLKNKKLRNNPVFVGTVQEEAGLRGARTSVQIVKPQIAIALDSDTAHDTYKIIPGKQKLGMGVAIKIYDRGALSDPRLVEVIMDLAHKHQIPAYKYLSQGGANDATELQYGNGGVAIISISLMTRYAHSALSVIHFDDLLNTVDLIEQFLLELDQNLYESKIQFK